MEKETKTAEEQLIRDLIDKYMNFKIGAEFTSIQHYGEYGAVSGSLFLNVKAMMKEFSNHRLTQQQEINAELKQTCVEYSNFVRKQTDEISELNKQLHNVRKANKAEVENISRHSDDVVIRSNSDYYKWQKEKSDLTFRLDVILEFIPLVVAELEAAYKRLGYSNSNILEQLKKIQNTPPKN